MVDQLAVDGIVQPPVVADSQRWRSLILDTEVWTSIQFMNDSHRMYLSKVDTGKKNIVLWLERHPDRKDTLTYELPQPDKMILEGALDGHQVSAKLTRIPLSDPVIFQLTNRGFHWINTTTEWHPE